MTKKDGAKLNIVSKSNSIPGVKNIIAVASGKGGVGKSTTTVGLALALQHQGARVGILDADIYGPNIPLMLGVSERPKSHDAKHLEPVVGHGIQSMSIGYLLQGDDQPMAWRGPMVSTALQQLLRDTKWDNLDYLLIDLPPGTGDIHLTLSQKIPVAGGVVVTTPQSIALADAKRGLQFFKKVNVPVLGIIENMSEHICSACGHVDAIFDEGGGADLAGRYDVELLGCLPLDRRIREAADNGHSTLEIDPKITEAYENAAVRLAEQLASLGKGVKFPDIVVVNE